MARAKKTAKHELTSDQLKDRLHNRIKSLPVNTLFEVLETLLNDPTLRDRKEDGSMSDKEYTFHAVCDHAMSVDGDRYDAIFDRHEEKVKQFA